MCLLINRSIVNNSKPYHSAGFSSYYSYFGWCDHETGIKLDSLWYLKGS